MLLAVDFSPRTASENRLRRGATTDYSNSKNFNRRSATQMHLCFARGLKSTAKGKNRSAIHSVPKDISAGFVDPTFSVALQIRAGLRFSAVPLSWRHADLRISLREVREGQRDSGSFQRLEGH
jgi:hypothetical protein